jgi:hypothetical protein
VQKQINKKRANDALCLIYAQGIDSSKSDLLTKTMTMYQILKNQAAAGFISQHTL